MKHLRTSILMLFAVILFSCEEEKGPSEFLEISPTDLALNFEAEGGTRYYTVKALERSKVQVSSSNPEWCRAILTDADTDNLHITAEPNRQSQNRTAFVKISNTADTIQINVEQIGLNTDITVSSSNISVQYGEPKFSIEITSAIPIAFELPEWISEGTENRWEKGTKRYDFTLTQLSNEEFYREGTIRIRPRDERVEMEPMVVTVKQKAPVKIIAHRGYWEKPQYPQNSIASLQRALELGIYGSELDVWITQDGVLVLNHDASIAGINVENATHLDLQQVRLSNGEPLPLLENCIQLIEKQQRTKLIIEIKPHASSNNENRAVDAILKLVKRYGVEHLVDYISFSENICKRIIAANPNNRVAFLGGNIAPAALKSAGYWGLDYAASVLKNNSGWLATATDIGLTTNVWTVNTNSDMEYFITQGVRFITTDYPQTLKEILNTRQ